MTHPTYDDANIMLKLYELWGDPQYKKSMGFIFSEDFINDYDGFLEKYPPGSDEHGYFIDYVAWYELLGTLWKHDLINQTLLFDWLLITPRWKRVENLVQGYREANHEPRLFENFEAMAKAESGEPVK